MPVQIQYSSLPNYEEREEDFNAEAVLLRRRFTEDGVACGASFIRPCTSCNVLAAVSAMASTSNWRLLTVRSSRSGAESDKACASAGICTPNTSAMLFGVSC